MIKLIFYFYRIDNLVLIILKQDQLEQIDTLVVYNESTMMFSGSIEKYLTLP